MRAFLFLLVSVMGSIAIAETSLFQKMNEQRVEEIGRQIREQEQASFLAESEVIGQKIAALNNTTATFYPDVRSSPVESGAFEDVVSGEWRLGNGGACIRTVWTEQILCRGAQGFSLKPVKQTRKKSKR